MIFKEQFSTWACVGDTISATHDGFDLTATIYHDDCGDMPDERDDGFWPSLDPKSAGWIGPKSKSTLARYMKRAQEIMRAWKNDEWFYCGIAVTVSKNGINLTGKYDAALWGIKCNYPQSRGKRTNAYLRDVANDLANEALTLAANALKALVADVEWSGEPDPFDPDNYWIDDKTGKRIKA